MKKLLVIGLLVFAAPAQASTVVAPGARFPYQQWVDVARVPTPDVVLRIEVGIAPCGPGASGCTIPEQGTIWLRPDLPGWLTRFVFLHEVGHNYFHATGSDWNNERLADAYAYCAIGPRVARRAGLGHHRWVGEVCRALRPSASEAARR